MRGKLKTLRKLYIKTTSLTHGYQDNHPKMVSFYRLWAPVYDLSIKLDPAYRRNLVKMVEATVSPGDWSLDVGCGTGLATVPAARISKKVLGIDSSQSMLEKLERKLDKLGVSNVQLITGFFPEAIDPASAFDSIISSFMLAHLGKTQRTQAIKSMFDFLKPGGNIGLFSARGEIAPTFQTKEEIFENLSTAGFSKIEIKDVDDIYRISTASK